MMINDYLQMLLGAYHEFVNPEYTQIDYFDSIICVMGLGGLIVGGFGLLLLTALCLYKGLFKGVK